MVEARVCWDGRSQGSGVPVATIAARVVHSIVVGGKDIFFIDLSCQVNIIADIWDSIAILRDGVVIDRSTLLN